MWSASCFSAYSPACSSVGEDSREWKGCCMISMFHTQSRATRGHAASPYYRASEWGSMGGARMILCNRLCPPPNTHQCIVCGYCLLEWLFHLTMGWTIQSHFNKTMFQLDLKLPVNVYLYHLYSSLVQHSPNEISEVQKFYDSPRH